MWKKRIAILGASRGLGLYLAKTFQAHDQVESLLLSSRKIQSTVHSSKTLVCTCDFSDIEQQTKLLIALSEFRPTALFYVAGGGPHGDFSKKEWKDHKWAFEVNLLFPAKLLHYASSNLAATGLEKAVFVGSAIAEDKPDVQAASYAASKHGLKGLISTVASEETELDVRLFSPGYMDTQLLPKNASARQQPGGLMSPSVAANELISWLESRDRSFHRLFE